MRPMRMRTLLMVTAAILVACSGGEAPHGPEDGIDCGVCLVEQACDRSTGTCVRALGESEPCGPDHEGICGEGLSCGAVPPNGEERCSRACSASTAAEVCGTEMTCFARPRRSGETSGFCARPAGEGEACDATRLIFCSGENLTCITPTEERSDGTCFRRCDPSLGAAHCAAGQVCADPFPSTPNVGICVVPLEAGARCDHTELRFCATGELCARPGPDSWGYCHTRCVDDADCSGQQTCVEPTEGIRFCADAVPLDGICSAFDDLYCARGDMCVRVGDETLCKRDCTEKGACPSGLVCTALDGSDRMACL